MTGAPTIRVAGPGPPFVELAAGTVAGTVREALKTRGACALMLAGGGTPRAVYARLARGDGAVALPWEKITIYFGDERCVPPEDPASNYGMVRGALLDRLPAAPSAVHRMHGEDSDPERAAEAYAALLPERIDVLILGVGADGHTASLFPGSAAVAERARRVLPVRGPAPHPMRLTITPPVIRAARSVIVLVSGAAKAPVVARVLGAGGDSGALPAALARDGLWILDREAASGLPRDACAGGGEEG